jgi:pimeloyl-ACP methyl ester carboxylesterase
MKTIYCISGLGADEKAFSKLNITGYHLHVIPWLQPYVTETLEAYAERMRATINEPEPILMGLSFGGMVCIEIAKQIPVKKVIIISSIKSAKELPFWMRTVAGLKLNKIVPIRSNYKLTSFIQNHFLGVTTDEEKALVNQSRIKANTKYIQWSVDKIVNWKNDWIPPVIFHIHGDKDKMFPIKRIAANYIVKNGGHFMIMNKADEVSRLIHNALKTN